MTVLLALAVCLPFQPAQDGAKRKSGIAAWMNGEPITWEEIYGRLKGVKPADVTEELLQRELRRAAETRLFLQEAAKLKIVVTDREIDQAVARIIRAFGGKERFEQYLRFKGVSTTEHREMLRDDLMERKLHAYIIRKGAIGEEALLLVEAVTPGEIREYYGKHRDQFKAIQYCDLFRIGLQFRTPREKEIKSRMAASLLRKLRDHTDMYLLAQYFSDVRRPGAGGQADFSIRQLQRDNDFFQPATTTYLFEELPVRGFSRVVEDGNTFNIFWIVDRVNKPAESFEEAQIKIRNELENRKRQEQRRILRGRLLQRAHVRPKNLFD